MLRRETMQRLKIQKSIWPEKRIIDNDRSVMLTRVPT
jgi:hypothetical protein